MEFVDLTPLKIFLSSSVHAQAQGFYKFQANPYKAKQVYLNTLAVHAVNNYLNCLGVETDIMAGDSWNPVMQTLTDSADLVIKNRGKVECRPVLPQARVCQIPAEVWQERIGYVAVQFNAQLTEATLLGCLKTVKTESVSLNEFQPLDNLINYLFPSSSKPLNLRQWFQQIFEFNWQNLENFIDTNNPTWVAVRESHLSSRTGELEIENNSIIGAKIIDLGVKLGEKTVFLVITIVPEEEDKLGVQVQLYPSPQHSYLPPSIELSLLGKAQDILANVASRSYDNFIQLPYFKGKAGEAFNIKVTLEEMSIMEQFTC